MTEREKFEAWANGQQPGTLDLTPFEDTYDSDFTSRAWDAWQARALLAACASEGQAVGQEDAWEAYLDEQKRIAYMPGLHARPCFFAGYQAGLAALRERIAGMEKDAARYRKAVAIGWLNALVTENLDHMIEKDKA